MFKNLRRKEVPSPTIRYTSANSPSSPSTVTSSPSSPSSPSHTSKSQIRKLVKQCVSTRNLCLDLSNCGIQHLPYEMTECKHVEEIDLSWNELSMLPNWFCSTFTHLKVLRIRGNFIFELPDNLFLLRDLKEIDLSCNKFEYFPRGLVSMRWLEIIDISDNCLLNIPSDIDKMKNSLRSLDISGNSLMTLPVEFQKLKKLKTLYIDDNNFLQSEIATVSKIFEPMLRSKRDRKEVINQLVLNQQEHLGYSSTTLPTYRDKYSTSEYVDRLDEDDQQREDEWEEDEEEDVDDEFEQEVVYPYEDDEQQDVNMDIGNLLTVEDNIEQKEPITPTLDTKGIMEVMQHHLTPDTLAIALFLDEGADVPLAVRPQTPRSPRISPRISPRDKSTSPRISPRPKPITELLEQQQIVVVDRQDDLSDSESDTETGTDLTKSSEDLQRSSDTISPTPSSPLKIQVPPIKITKPPSVPSLALAKVMTPRSIEANEMRASPKSPNPQLTITANSGRTRAVSDVPERPKTARVRQRVIDHGAMRPMTGDFSENSHPRIRPIPLNRQSVRNPNSMIKDRIGILIEILESERKYVKYLNLLNDLYYQPLVHSKETLVSSDHKDNLQTNPTFKKKPVAPEPVIKNMFPSNLTTIITFHTKFLHTLEQKYISSVPSYQKQGGINLKETEAVMERMKKTEESSEVMSLFEVKIGETFKITAPFFKIYVSYLAAYERSMSIIRMQKAKSKVFECWLKNRKKMVWSEGLDIGSLLIMPCQRTPRYQILLNNLLQNTPMDHADRKDLETALELVKDCAAYQNEKIRETNNKMKVHQLSKLLNNPDLVQPHRRLVREGDLYLKTSKHKQRGYLFNDILILREMKKNPFGMTARQGLVLQYYLMDVKISQETPQTIVVNFEDDDGKELGEIEIIFDSEKLKEDWKSDIKSVMKELSAKREHLQNSNAQERLKKLNRRSLTLKGTSNTQLFPPSSGHERSQSVEITSSSNPLGQDKGKRAENMKNFLSKLGISAQSVVSARKPRLSIAGTNFRHSLLRNNSGALAEALKGLHLEDYDDASSPSQIVASTSLPVTSNLKRHSADSISPTSNNNRNS